mmetsp:Transcript_22394/g.54226  ORF Transcript_22394/g.54226 Transcript_22394/m.54226 type:complete len:114 (+) Transcript_22394:790-1131(+)
MKKYRQHSTNILQFHGKKRKLHIYWQDFPNDHQTHRKIGVLVLNVLYESLQLYSFDLEYHSIQRRDELGAWNEHSDIEEADVDRSYRIVHVGVIWHVSDMSCGQQTLFHTLDK